MSLWVLSNNNWKPLSLLLSRTTRDIFQNNNSILLHKRKCSSIPLHKIYKKISKSSSFIWFKDYSFYITFIGEESCSIQIQICSVNIRKYKCVAIIGTINHYCYFLFQTVSLCWEKVVTHFLYCCSSVLLSLNRVVYLFQVLGIVIIETQRFIARNSLFWYFFLQNWLWFFEKIVCFWI